MIYAETDLAEFEQVLRRYQSDLKSALPGVGQDLAEEAERDARSLLELQVYSQPESPNYERTRRLIDSVNGYVTVGQDGISVTLEALGGNMGRLYAEYVEAGTYGSRVDLDRIMADARGGDILAELNYGGSTGMKARPAVIPAVANLERNSEEALFGIELGLWFG